MNARVPAEIDGRTRLAGLIGWPVEHSLSPAMHNAAYAALGMNWRYLAFAVPPTRLAGALAGLRGLGLAGLNVTIPHKEAVLPLLDELTPAARAIGAVNTIALVNERLIGDNTDVAGFLAALDAADVAVPGCRALILGTGGAARAAAYGVLSRGGSVRLLARSEGRAAALAGDLQKIFPGGSIAALSSLSSSVDLLVNATPVGMWPQIDASPLPDGLTLQPGLAVMDMVYRPLETLLLQEAQRCGARIVSGLEMLVQQGAAAFARWAGRPAPVEILHAACLHALERSDAPPPGEDRA